MANQKLPKEIVDLARALKEAGTKPQTSSGATEIERKLEEALRAQRTLMKTAKRKIEKEREENEIKDAARKTYDSWGGYSGDPGRKLTPYKRYLKKQLAKGRTKKQASAGWKRLSAASKAKWAKPAKRAKRKGASRDPGRHHRAKRVRAMRHTRRRHRRHPRRHPR